MRYDWVSAVCDGERFAVILADPGGHAFASFGIIDDRWMPWSSVSQGWTIAGAPVTASWNTSGTERAMYLTDPNGGVYQPDQDGFAGCRATTCMRSTSSHSTAPPATPRNAQVIVNDPLRPKHGSRQGLSC